MNDFLISLIAENMKSYPSIRNAFFRDKVERICDMFFHFVESSTANALFLFDHEDINNVFVRFLQDHENSDRRIYIDCDCGECNRQKVCSPVVDVICELQLVGRLFPRFKEYRDAKIFINQLSKNHFVDFLDAVDDYEDVGDQSVFQAFGFLGIKPVRDWKSLIIVPKKIDQSNKKKEEIVYVLNSESYYGLNRSSLGLYYFKKNGMLQENLNINDLKALKFKINSEDQYKNELDEKFILKLKSILLSTNSRDARYNLGRYFDSLPLIPKMNSLVLDIAKSGKLYFEEKSHLRKIDIGSSQHNEEVLGLRLKAIKNEESYEVSLADSVDQAIGINDELEIVGNKLYFKNESLGELKHALEGKERVVKVSYAEINDFLNYFSELGIKTYLNFEDKSFSHVEEQRIELEIAVMLNAETCKLQPLVNYGEHKFLVSDSRLQVLDVTSKKVFSRKISNEKTLLNKLSDEINFLNWEMDVPIEVGYELIKKLDDLNIPMTYKSKRLVPAKKFQFTATSSIDWIDIKGSVDFGELGLLSIAQLKSSLKKGQFHEFKNGEVGLLPRVFEKKYRSFLQLSQTKSDDLRMNKLHAGFLNEKVLGELNIRPDEEFKKYIQSFDVLHQAKSMQPESGSNPTFNGTLRDYQHYGVNWLKVLKENSLNGILADDMGLGKTVQIIAHLSQEANRHPKDEFYLIVVPKSLLHNWKNEIEKFSTNLIPHVLLAVPDFELMDQLMEAKKEKVTKQAQNGKAHVFIVTYHLLRSKSEFFEKLKFDYIIADEAQNIKNDKTQISKAIMEIEAVRKVALTGTPIENSILDLANILEFLFPGAMTAALKDKLTEGSANRQDGVKENFLGMFSNFISPLILRRSKKQVLRDLPEKTEKNVLLTFSEDEERQYQVVKKAAQYSLLEEESHDLEGKKRPRSLQVIEAILRLRQTALDYRLIKNDRHLNHSTKIQTLVEFLDDVIKEGSKALVFSQFSSFLKLIASALDENKYSYSYIDGTTKNRNQELENFKADSCNVLLSTLKTGGVGLNLTEAEYVFIMDPWWNPAVEAQAIDRTHRIGQKKPVVVYRFIMKDSIEEKVLELQNKKRDLASSILEYGEEGLFKSLKKSDIDALFL